MIEGVKPGYLKIVDISKKNNKKDLIVVRENNDKIESVKRISNKEYEKMMKEINKVNHYYDPIKTPCYIVTLKGGESFYIITNEVDIKL